MTDAIHFLTTYLRFDWFGMTNILAGLLNILIGFFILIQNPKAKLNQAYFFITTSAFMWVLGLGMASMTATIQDGYFWTKLAWIFGVPFISPAVFWFSQIWVGGKVNKTFFSFSLVGAGGISAVWFLKGEKVFTILDHSWGRYTYYHHTFFAYGFIALAILFFFFFAGLAFRTFYVGWKKERDPFRKKQFQNILIGYLIAYTGSIDFVTAITGRVFPFGYISLTFLTTITAYTIVKYKFLDIKFVLKKMTLALAIYLLLAFLIFPLSIPIIQNAISKGGETSVFQLLGLLIFSGLTFSLGPFIYARFVKKEFWFKTHASAGLTHELKSPLSGIKMALDQIEDKIPSTIQKDFGVEEYLKIAKKNEARLGRFIQDLLNLLKIQEGSFDLNKTIFKVRDMIDGAISIHGEFAKIKEIQIEVNCKSNLLFFGDKEKLTQTVSNLVSNSVKFSSRGRIFVKATPRKKFLEISVEDEGIGLGKLAPFLLFDRFFQGNKGSKGSGIGLTISKAWVKAHNGNIRISNNETGRGTRAVFQVPYL